MPSKRQPKHDEVIEGTRVRVYATRSEYEVLVGDGDIADPEAPVWCYSKIGTADVWARQGWLDAQQEKPDAN